MAQAGTEGDEVTVRRRGAALPASGTGFAKQLAVALFDHAEERSER